MRGSDWVPPQVKRGSDWVPGQVEGAGADVDIEVLFGQGTTQLLQVVPSLPVEMRTLGDKGTFFYWLRSNTEKYCC